MTNTVNFEEIFIKKKAKQYGLAVVEVKFDYDYLKMTKKLNDLDNMLSIRRAQYANKGIW